MPKIHFERFDNLLKFLPKSKIKAGAGQDSGKYPFFKSGNDQSKFIDTAIFEGESLIIGDGGSANVNFYDKKFSSSDHCYVIQRNIQDIDIKYVYYYLKSNLQILEAGFKGAGLKNISKKYISGIKIPLLALQDQQKIARLLTNIEELINKREKSIKLLDQLTKSTFLNMFNISSNSNLPKVKLKEITLKITDGTHQSPKFVDKGIPFIFVSNIVNNTINYKTNKFISEEEYNNLSKRTPIEIGNILLTTVGSYGNPAIIKSTHKFAFQRHIAFLKPNHDLINYQYLFESLRSDMVKFQIDKKVKGVAQKTLNLSDLKEIEIYLPTRDSQDKFAEIATQIENTKAIYQNSLNELNNLFGSFAQKAFKGELDVSKIEQVKTTTKVVESQEKIIENKIDHVNVDETLIFSKELVKILINQAGQLTNEKLMNTIKQYNFKDKVSFDYIKNTIVELLENQEIEQISVLDDSEEMIGFKVKK